MPFKLSFIFEAGPAGWTEQWYSAEADVPTALSRLTAAFWQQFFAPRGDGVTCTGIRVSDVNNPRSAQIKRLSFNRTGLGIPTGKADEPPQAALLIRCQLTGGGGRTIAIRGLYDQAYPRDASGTYAPTAQQISDVNKYMNAVNVIGGLLSRHLLPSGGTNNDVPVLSVTGTVPNGDQTILNLAPGGLFVVGARVIFHRMPFNTFPGLRGTHLVVATGTNQITVPVRYTSAITTVNTAGGLVRNALYSLVTVASYFLTDFREKKVGRPFFSPRGRRQAVRYAPR